MFQLFYICVLPLLSFRQKESLNSGPGPDHSANTMRITFSCLPASWRCSVSLLSLGCAPRQRLLLLLFITSTLLLGTYQRQLWGLGTAAEARPPRSTIPLHRRDHGGHGRPEPGSELRRGGGLVLSGSSYLVRTLVNDVVLPSLSGISTLATSPTRASDYLYPLLSFAAAHVPRSKHKETPLYILCTAGMRLLPDSQQTAILEDLITDVPLDFEFLFSSSHAEVISGKQEGVYAWIGINFVLGRFDHADDEEATVEVTTGSQNQQPISRRRTVGIMDMGGGFTADRLRGASAITFSSPQKLLTTQLGLSEDKPYLDPCLPLSLQDSVVRENRTLSLRGQGDWTRCQEAVRPFLGIHNGTMSPGESTRYQLQPFAPINFSNSEFYGFSEFFYCTEDVLRLGGQYDSRKYSKAAMDYCATKWSTLKQRLDNKLFSQQADISRLKYQCFKSAWMFEVLHSGFRFPPDYRSLRTAQLVYDKEVQWTLGAILFKTRFLPLRDLQQETLRQNHPSWLRSSFLYNHHLFSLCVLVVVLAILLYILRLRRIHQREQRQSETLKLLWAEEGEALLA
ncbi:hypothetical protein KUCAC02_031728 [Chaenocephalus aceratus]|nr:hypothetical protein KUCAC02_031728 [Chaenocephalus aceratus]